MRSLCVTNLDWPRTLAFCDSSTLAVGASQSGWHDVRRALSFVTVLSAAAPASFV